LKIVGAGYGFNIEEEDVAKFRCHFKKLLSKDQQFFP